MMTEMRFFFDYIGPVDPFDVHISYAVRFTPHSPCSLLTVTTQFYSTGINSYLRIWSDASGFPYQEKLKLKIDRTILYPNWQTIDISSYGLHFDSDFYIGFSSTTLDSFVLFDSTIEANHYTLYVDSSGFGLWNIIPPGPYWGDPLIRAIIKYDQATDVVESHETLSPASFSLHQNWPNPFNSSTRIAYSLSHPTEVRIVIYNILGQKIKTLTDEFQTQGHKTIYWDGTDKRGALASSGIYFCKIQAGEFSESKKIVLLK